MTSTQEYQDDVRGLLALMTPANQVVVMKAIELVSKYAGRQRLKRPVVVKHPMIAKQAPKRPVAVKPTPTPAPAEEATPEQPVTDQFRVVRRLIGAEVGDRYISERSVRALNLADGDLVKLLGAGANPTLRLIEKAKPKSAPKIARAPFAVLQADPALPADYTLSATVDLHDKPLFTTEDDVPFKFLIRPADVDRLHLKAGSVVELAWNRTEGPQHAVVAWVHPEAEVAAAKAPAPQPKPQKDPDATPKGYTPKIPFDLAGKRVLFVGNADHRNEMSLVVAAHRGGAVSATSATKGSQLKNKVTHADVMILITDEVHHVTTNTSIKIAKSQKVPYAVATSDAPFNIERALYRALNKMPAYEPAAGAFDYPTVAD